MESSEDSNQEKLIKEKIALAKKILDEFKILEKERLLRRGGSQRKMPLWLFMIVLLKSDEKNICVNWTKKEEYEFKVTNTKGLAEIWGMLKLNSSMTYPKITRALRYYYGKQLIEKVAEQPYTYSFVLSERTKYYLPKPSQENTKRSFRVNGLDSSPASYQRPRSLPDTFSPVKNIQNGKSETKRKQDVGSFFSKLFKKSDRLSPLACVKERERTFSLPSRIRWIDESGNGLRLTNESRNGSRLIDESDSGLRWMDESRNGSRLIDESGNESRWMNESRNGSRLIDESGSGSRWMDESASESMSTSQGGFESPDLFSDLTVLSSDDWEDEFLLRRSAKQLETPVTSCFTAKDLPLLDFEDIRSLDDDICSDASTSCSYASPRSSEPSFDMELSSRSSVGWVTDMHDVHDIDVEAADLSVQCKLNNLLFNNQYQNGHVDVTMDMDTEMDLVEEYISQHSN